MPQHSKARSWKRRMVKIIVAAVSSLAIVVGVAYAADALAQEPDYSWYTANPNAESFQISNGSQLRGLSNLVNGTADVDGDGTPEEAVDFQGKTVSQTGIISLANQEFTPIGTVEHPFEGTFVGGRDAGLDIRRLQITQGNAYLGLFGYCGSSSILQGVYISDSTLTGYREANITIANESDGQVTADTVIHDIGAVVGYTKGSISNCESLVTVSVETTLTAVAAHPEVVVNVGGLAGTVEGSISDCSHEADLSITASSLASDTQDSVVANVGGIVGTLGTQSDDGRTSSAGTISNCTNGLSDDGGRFGIGKVQATLKVTTTGVGGLDRFGVEKEATSLSVGGIVGYSYGSVDSCTNYGLVNTNSTAAKMYKSSDGRVHIVAADNLTPSQYPSAENLFVIANGGSAVGGIVGTLRDEGVGVENQARTDSGSNSSSISVTQCFNTGSIIGLARTGGIVGAAGSYANIDGCRNGKVSAASGTGVSDDSGHIVSTRWNKPYTGGIVGATYSNVSNCSNLTEVENIQTGYYTAGVVGGLFSPTDYTSECYASFNTGQVHVASYATQSYREAGIVGNNAGYVHDCVMRSGSVLAHDDEGSSYPNAAIGDDSWGMWSNIKFFSTDDLKKSEAAAVLNASHAQDVLNLPEQEWVYWYIASGGYPTLNIWDEPASRTALTSSNVSASSVQLAEYAGNVEAIPQLIVTYKSGSTETTLVQNVDFYVIPQEGATAMTDGGKPYKASIIGIGNYEGTVEDVCNYGIGPCDLANCEVSVTTETYNFDTPVYPDEVYVTNPAGVQLDSSEFRYEIYSSTTYSLTSSNTKNYVVYDSEGYVSWDGGATRDRVASQHERLCGDLSGVDFILYNADGVKIYEVNGSDRRVIDPDDGTSVKADGPICYKTAKEGVNDGGLAGYVVKVSAKGTSTNLKSGSWTTGQYVINALDLYTDCQIDEVKVEVPTPDGTSTTTQYWYWNAEKNMLYEKDENGNPVTTADGTLKQAAMTFTGDEIQPTVTVTYEKEDGTKITIPNDTDTGYYLVYGDPYTTKVDLDYVNRDATPLSDNTSGVAADDSLASKLEDHEKAAVTVRTVLKMFYTNYVHMYFTIDPASIDECAVSVAGGALDEVGTYAYRGGYAVRPTVDLSLCGNELIAGRDYTVTYDNNVEPTTDEALQAYYENGDTSGLASYTITGLGNVEGDSTGYFIISPGQSLTEKGYTIQPIADQQSNFNHEVRVPGGLSLLDKEGNSSGLKEGVDYRVVYTDNIYEGTAKVYVYGINAYTGMLATTFEIVPFDMSDPANAWRISDLTYVGGSKDWKTEGLKCNEAYTAINRKVYIVQDWNTMELDGYQWASIAKITYVNNATGATYEWDKSLPSTTAAAVPPGAYTVSVQYERGSTTYEATIVKNEVSDLARLFSCEAQTYTGKSLEPTVKGVPSGLLTVTYADNVDAGTGRYTVTAPYDSTYYTGSYVGTFVINKFDVANADILVNNQLYTGSAVTPKVTVSAGGTTYVEGVDYEVEYVNNTKRGTATAVVTGIGGCEGSANATFTIGNTLSIAQAVTSPISAQMYTGSALTPEPSVVYEGTVLRKDVDYSLSYGNNIKVSTADSPATITITGLNVYAGSTATVSFTIVEKRSIADATCVLPDQAYTGEALQPALDVAYAGTTLAEGVDYTVEYRCNVKAGASAKAVLTGQGVYEGTLEVPFEIYVDEGTVTSFGEDAHTATDFAIEVAKETYPNGAEGAIVVWNKDYAAQIAAATVSRVKGYPIVLTETDSLSTGTLQYLRESGVDNVIVLGGADKVSTAVEQTLSDVLKAQVQRVESDTDQSLAVLLAQMAGAELQDGASSASATRAVLVNPTQMESAAAAAAYAAADRLPLYYTEADGTLDQSTEEALSSYMNVIAVGDAFAVDLTLETELPSTTVVERLAGANRYAQNAAVVSYALQSGCQANGAVVVNAPSLSRYLTVIALCAERGVPLVLASSQSTEAVETLAEAAVPAYGLVALGDAEAFPQSLCDAVSEAMGWRGIR